MVKVSITCARLRALAVALIATACVISSPVAQAQGEATGWPGLSVMPPQGLGRDDAALVIGIEDYAFAPDVPGAVQNAEDWYQYFIKTRQVPIGSVKLLRDSEASLEMIEEAAEDMARRVRAGGTLWVVFIGHGAPQASGEDGVLIGMDAQQTAKSLYSRSIPQRRLAALVEGGAQSHTVFILDACFSGKVGADQMFADGLQPMVLVKTPSSVTVLSAGASNEFAGPLPGIARPAFSYLLLGAMRGWADADADGAVTADEAMDYARVALQVTVKDRKQTPQMTGPQPPLLSKPASPEPGPDLAALVLAQHSAQPTPSPGAAPSTAQGDMVTVPAGEFWMGCHPSDSRCQDDEKPGEPVYLDAFRLDKAEVTVDAYKACVHAGRCTLPNATSDYCSGDRAQAQQRVEPRTRQSPCQLRGLEPSRHLLSMGRQAATHRGAVGEGRARHRRAALSLGRRGAQGRRARGQLRRRDCPKELLSLGYDRGLRRRV
jgi:formylglycine-generating enzyme required for sulfatase activity